MYGSGSTVSPMTCVSQPQSRTTGWTVDLAERGTTEWIKVTQQQVDLFADAILASSMDPHRCRTGGPSTFKGTIAHGYLTLSLTPTVIAQVLEYPRERWLQLRIEQGEAFRATAGSVPRRARPSTAVAECTPENLRVESVFNAHRLNAGSLLLCTRHATPARTCDPTRTGAGNRTLFRP